jgi:hypothetical protein
LKAALLIFRKRADSAVRQLPDKVRHKCTCEARYESGRGCYGDQVDGPGVVTSTCKVEMSGVSFVSICVKAHDRGPRSAQGEASKPEGCLDGSSDR